MQLLVKQQQQQQQQLVVRVVLLGVQHQEQQEQQEQQKQVKQQQMRGVKMKMKELLRGSRDRRGGGDRHDPSSGDGECLAANLLQKEVDR